MTRSFICDLMVLGSFDMNLESTNLNKKNKMLELIAMYNGSIIHGK